MQRTIASATAMLMITLALAPAALADGTPQDDAGTWKDAPPFPGAVPIATGAYSGELVPSENDSADGYEALANWSGVWYCPAGTYRVHVEGQGIQVRLSGAILDTPADFRWDSCVSWVIQPVSGNATG